MKLALFTFGNADRGSSPLLRYGVVPIKGVIAFPPDPRMRQRRTR
jgi:hypothetical protein